jgi:hypothetical protein
LEQVGEAGDRVEVGSSRRRQREEAAILDQEQVVLADPEGESLDLKRAVANAPYERMGVLG